MGLKNTRFYEQKINYFFVEIFKYIFSLFISILTLKNKIKIIVEIKYIIGGLVLIFKTYSAKIKIPIAIKLIIDIIINIEYNIKFPPIKFNIFNYNT